VSLDGSFIARACEARLARLEQLATQAAASWRRLDHGHQQQAMHTLADALTDLRLALARLEQLIAIAAGRAPLHHTPVELSDVAMALLARWKPLAPAHALELALPGELPQVVGDDALISEMLHLLIESVVRLTPNGGTVRVELRPRDDEVLVSLSYDGPALDAAELDRIYREPLHPAEGPGAELGLAQRAGLALAAATLAAHGGSLSAEHAATGTLKTAAALLAVIPLLPPVAAPVLPSLDEQPFSTRAGHEDDQLAAVAVARQQPVVLVIEREPRVLRYLRANLSARQYRPIVASDLTEGLRLIELEEPDLILCELSAGALDLLRETTIAPIVLLAPRYDSDECARLLMQGAAEYLAKPIHLDELLARIGAVLRSHAAARLDETREPVFRTGHLEVDLTQRLVTVAGKPVTLSRTEFKLLRELVRHAGMVLPHETLLERVWGPAYSQETEFIWVYVRRLRRKIEPDPSSPCYIQTVPGVGYRLVRQMFPAPPVP
jgi:two-component system KDP operon response regulator KdpE